MGVTGTDSLDVVIEVSEGIGAVSLKDVGTRFPVGRKWHQAIRNKKS